MHLFRNIDIFIENLRSMTTARPACYILLSFLIAWVACVSDNPDKEEWLYLFNGKDLSGWNIKISGQDINDNFKNTFVVEDGVLKVSYDEYASFDDKYGHIYYHQPFSYYILQFEYRFVGEQIKGGAEWNVRNSGVMVHSQSAQSMAFDQEFPVSLEVQLLGGLGEGERPTGNLCTPGTYVEMDGKVNMAHCINSTSKTYDGDQWVSVKAVVLGDSLVMHIVEGDTVLTYQKPKIGEDDIFEKKERKEGVPLKEGYIALQAESHPIEFRNITLLNLKGCTNPKCSNYKSYHIVSDNCSCMNEE